MNVVAVRAVVGAAFPLFARLEEIGNELTSVDCET
jgi:hypothetical protein